ncbi:MAG: hypothetical protein GXY06_05405 [Clostridiaceae bacterium]|nr:hypothetical protein [Clostridiaceae bacterium]
MHFVFIVNARSGLKAASQLEKAVRLQAERDKNDYHFLKTEYAGHAKELAEEYSNRYRNEAIIFACGGDGTVHEIANAVAFSQTPVGVIPMGTGNDFARTVLSQEMYDNPLLIIQALNRIDIRSIDLLRVDCYNLLSDHIPELSVYSVNITSFGLDTAINDTAMAMVKKHPNSRFFKKRAYDLAILKCFFKGWRYSFRYSLELADELENIDSQCRYTLACICNARYYGKGFCPSPNSRVDDGTLEVCIVDDLTRRKALPLIGKYKKGKHLGHPNVHSFKVTSGVIASTDVNRPLRGNYDGELFSASQIRFEVIPASLPFVFFPSLEANPE